MALAKSGNGRTYCPTTMQFVSPDPIIQSLGNSANYNRYSYCMNNPIMYTDPSGYQHYPYQDEVNAINKAQLERWLSMGAPGGGGGDGSITPHLDRWRYQASGGLSYNWSTGLYENVYSGESMSAGSFAFSGIAKSMGIVSATNEAAQTIMNYLIDGFDIEFIDNGTASYAIAMQNFNYLGSAAGITWNASFSNSGLSNGFNRGVHEGTNFSLGDDWFNQIQTGTQYGWNWSRTTTKQKFNHSEAQAYANNMEQKYDKMVSELGWYSAGAGTASGAAGVWVVKLSAKSNFITATYSAAYMAAFAAQANGIENSYNALQYQYNDQSANPFQAGFYVVTSTSRVTTMGTGMFTHSSTSSFYLPNGALFYTISH
ncbi:RHS repeat-associated core domain-containing protein [Saccharicrinis sp. GN24d3]